MSDADDRQEVQRTRGRLDQLVDDMEALLANMRDEIARERRDREEQ